MSTNVEFLLLEKNSQWIATAIASITQLYCKNERVLVLADNRQQLEQLDELLWHKSSEQFIPYSLDSECYNSSAAVLLSDTQPERRRYQALLNLGSKMTVNPVQFRSIIEVVDTQEDNKSFARERYKNYRHHKQLTASD